MWKPSTSSGFVKGVRLTRNGAVNFQKRGHQGYARRFVDRKEEIEGCGHSHTKRSCALTCATTLANRLNKEQA